MGAYGTMDEAPSRKQMREFQEILISLHDYIDFYADEDCCPIAMLSDGGINKMARWI